MDINSKNSNAIVKQIKEQYNTIAHDWNTTRYRPNGIKMMQIKKLKKGDTLLDLGCGNGLIAPFAEERRVKYFGLDISAKLIAMARRKYPKLYFKIANATKKLPFNNASFKWVFAFAVLHHIPTPKLRLKFLQEIYRVLKSKGRASIIVWNVLNEWCNKKYKIREQLVNFNQDLGENDVYIPWKATKGKIIQRYLHIFDKKELLLLAKLAGFRTARADYYNRAGEKEKNGEELLLSLEK